MVQPAWALEMAGKGLGARTGNGSWFLAVKDNRNLRRTQAALGPPPELAP